MTGAAGPLRRATMMTCAMLGIAGPARSALAQQALPTPGVDTVSGRSRPEYDPVGIRVGSLTVQPGMTASATHDDNIYRTARVQRADTFVALRPQVRIASNDDRYPLELEGSATIRRYARTGTENSEQYRVAGGIGANILSGMRLGLQGGYSRELEPRGSAGDVAIGGRPIHYDLLRGSATIARDVGRIGLEAGVDHNRYDYGALRLNGSSFPQDFRDYRVTSLHARLSHAVGPGLAAFVRGTTSRSRYPSARDGLDRGSRGYSVIAGVDLGITRLLAGSIGVGYLREDFASDAFGDISGLDYDISLDWSPTSLVSVSLRGERGVQRSPFVGSAGGIRTTIGARADYELLRPLILTAAIDATRETYREPDRRDRRIEARFGGRYLMSRAASLTAAIDYRRQASTGFASRRFDGLAATVGVTVQR